LDDKVIKGNALLPLMLHTPTTMSNYRIQRGLSEKVTDQNE